MTYSLRKNRQATDRRRQKMARRLEVLEARCLLAAVAASQTPSLEVDQSVYDMTSVLVRYHADASPFVQSSVDGGNSIIDFGAVPGLHQLELPEGLDVQQTVDFYGNYPGVLYAEPNFEINLTATPNDTDFDSLWGLNNTGQTGGIADADIDAKEAWDVTTGSSDTIVAVVDTGVDYLHPDLAQNIWSNPGEIAGDGIDNDGNGFVDDVHGYDFVSNDGDPMDDHSHGTHVAGTIGAVADNGIGVVGVSWNVQIMAVKFLNSQGSGQTAAAVSAIEYAVDNGATISNHSWGFNGSYSQALADAFEYARLADQVVVAAAGNGGADRIGDDNDALAFYPGNFQHDNLIAVAATDDEDSLAIFSNYGLTQVDLAAPGVGILSTTPDNTYSTFSGTSMATPHVAGAVALLRSQYPDWSYSKIRDRILDTVDLIPALHLRSTTGGRLNVAAAVAPDGNGPSVIANSPSGEVMKAQNRVRVTFDERIEVGSFSIDDITDFQGPDGAVGVTAVTAVADSAGRQFDVSFESQATLGDYSLTIGPQITDPFGNPMNQDADGSNGQNDDHFIARFTIIPDTVGPYIVSTSPSGGLDVPTDRVRITFDEPIVETSFTLDRISDFIGPGGPIYPTSIEPISSSEYDVVFPMQDTLGAYSFSVGGSIVDLAGNLLDQDRDGNGGETTEDRFPVEFDLQKWLYADQVIDFSSQYTTTIWSAAQALGEPNTFGYGDLETAWAPRYENGTEEYLTVGFEEPLLASGVSIRETFGNGFVRQVEARNAKTGEFVTVAQPLDDSVNNVAFDFLVTWPQTTYPVDAVRITIDTDHNLNAFEEIDSVQLRGVTVPDTDGARIVESSLNGSATGPIGRVEVMFDEPILDGSFTLTDVQAFTGPDGDINATAVNRLTGSHYEVTFPPQTTFGDYSLTIGPDILDLDGRPMNQDQDETDGEINDDAFEIAFNIELWQFAETLVDFSSQFGTSSWSAAQSLGPSDSFDYGDQRTAWASGNMNGTTESLTVAFADPVLTSGVQIRENFGNGFVRLIEVRDAETGDFSTAWSGTDDSQPGEVVDFVANWPLTTFSVDAVRIEIDTDHSANYEEIDSVQLRGVPAPDLRGPMIIATTPNAGYPEPVDHVELTFNEPIKEGTFTLEDVVSFDGPTGSITPISVDRLSDAKYSVTFAQQDAWGTYRMVIGPDLLDLADNPMDQNGDGPSTDPTEDQFELLFELELWQDASSVIDFSSQYSSTSWSAAQTLGAPDTFVYGDQRTAWAPKSSNGTTETLTVGFDTAVQSTGVIIRETFGNGFVRSVEVRDAETGLFQLVSTDTDDSLPGAPVDYVVSWPITDVAVDAVRITVDTNHSTSYEEIDSVRLRGIIPADTKGPHVIASTPDAGHPGPIDHIDLIFSEAIDEGTFDTNDVASFAGPNGEIAVDSVQRITDDEYRLSFQPQTDWGTYSLSVGPDVLDLSANPMEAPFELTFELELWQDASSVVDFSSQYSSTSWSAAQTLGAPDTFVYGDQRTAWAPKTYNGTVETLTVAFDTPVLSTGAIIRETYSNGFVRTVEVRDSETGQFIVMPTGPDDSQPGSPVDYIVSWPKTTYNVDALRITIDTDHAPTVEEIDSIRLRGVVAPDTTGPRVVATLPDATHSGSIDHIQLTFSEPIDQTSFTPEDVVSLIGPGGSIAVDAVDPVSDDTFQIRFASQSAFGTYSYTIRPEILDLSGNPMDQNQNGSPGESIDDRLISSFEVELWQTASNVIDVSSQYSATSWGAIQALGEPDTFVYKDSRTAWTPRYSNSGDQTLTVGFDTPVLSSGAIIRETYGNGFVRIVEVRDASTGQFHVMSTGPDDSLPGTPVDYAVSWPLTNFPVDAIRITIDTYHTSSYEEIDAVSLTGILP